MLLVQSSGKSRWEWGRGSWRAETLRQSWLGSRKTQTVLLTLCIYGRSDVTTVIIPKPFLSSELHIDVPGNAHKLRRNSPHSLGTYN